VPNTVTAQYLAQRMNIVLTTRTINSVFIGHEINTSFPCVMSNLPAEIEYTIVTDVLNSCCSSGQRCWEMSGYKSYLVSYFILLLQL
jgi:hypothetical protein